MTLEELRAKTQRSFKNDSERLFWMNAVNQTLAKDPDFFNPKPPLATSPEVARLHAIHAPLTDESKADAEPIIVCPICNVKLKTANRLKRHLIKAHSGLPRKPSKKQLKRRSKQNRGNQTLSCSDGSVRERCRDCGRIAVTGSDRCYNCGG